MTQENSTRIIALGDDIGPVTIKVNGITIDIDAQRNVVVGTPGSIVARYGGPEPGDLMPDGSVYVGKSASTGVSLYTSQADAGLMSQDRAKSAAKVLQRQYPGARLPTPAELKENLYTNKDKGVLSGSFNTSGGYPDSSYLSSGVSRDFATVVWFDSGFVGSNGLGLSLPVRFVWENRRYG